MKVNLRTALAVITIFIVIVSSGCDKVFDYIKHHPGEEEKLCRIDKLKITWGGIYQEFTIVHNAADNPTDIICTKGAHGGGDANSLEYHFRYDTHNRVSDYYFNAHGAIGVFVWKRYTYPDSKTILETQYAYTGNITDPAPPTGGTVSKIYNLDNDGRVIKITEPGSPPFITTFAYDAHGNLVRPASIVDSTAYDNKINLFRTNKVWMFIFNDYSVNNRIIYHPAPTLITQYNEFGLPVKFNRGLSGAAIQLFNYFYDDLEVVYACDEKKAGGY